MTAQRRQREEKCFAVAPPGMADLVAAELAALGVSSYEVEPAGVCFETSRATLLQLNRSLRVTSRILVRLGQFRCRDFPALFRQARKLPWGSYLRPGTPLEVRASSHRSRLVHSGRLADTLAEAVRHALGQEAEDATVPPQRLYLRLEEDLCTLSIDSSGDHLHRRGYRQEQGEAALRENLAAGLLLRAGWPPDQPLWDPFCGSGTLVIEAALLAAGRPPGAKREFALMRWPHYRPAAAETRVSPPSVPLLVGSDRAPAMVDLARRNAERAGVAELCRFTVADAQTADPPAERGWIVCNPPYGLRLGHGGTPKAIARLLTDLARRHPGWTVTGLTPDPALYPGATVLSVVDNGGQKVALVRLR